MNKNVKLFFAIVIASMLIIACKNASYAINLSDRSSVADQYAYDGELEFKKENYKEAIDKYMQSIEIYLDLGKGFENELAALYYVVGESYTKLSNNEMAVLYFEKSLDLSEETMEEKELIFSSYSYLTMLYPEIADSDVDIAMDYGKKAENFAKNYFGSFSVQMAEANKNLGKLSCTLIKFEQAESYWKKALEFYGTESNECAEIYVEMAKMYEIQEKYPEAENYLKDALELFKKNNRTQRIAKTYFDLAQFYGKRKNHNTSIEYHKMAIQAFEESGSSDVLVAASHYNMGTEYGYLGDWERFKEEMLVSYKMCQDLGMDSEMIKLLYANIIGSLEVYYDNFFEGDKSSGFDIWLKDFLPL